MMRKIWPFGFNFVLFAAFALVFPFIVVYYQGLGFTGSQIGVLTGVAPLVTFFVAPLWTTVADTRRQHRLMMSAALLLGAATMVVFPLLTTFVPILLFAILLNAFMAPISAFADSATMFMLADKQELYGRVRIGGTIGYGLAAAASGFVVQSYGLTIAFWGCAALLLVGFVISQKLVFGQPAEVRSNGGQIRRLLSNPRWLLFLALAFAGGLSLAALNNYLFPYMKELGASESTMGLALTIGTISEVPTLFFINTLIRRLKPFRLLILTMVLTAIRMLLYAACGSPQLALFIQLLNGLNIAAMWVAGVSYADENAPAGLRSTAQGLFSAVFYGIGLAIGGLVGGPLLESIGGRGLYLTFGIDVLATVVIVVLLQKWIPTEKQPHPNEAFKGNAS